MKQGPWNLKCLNMEMILISFPCFSKIVLQSFASAFSSQPLPDYLNCKTSGEGTPLQQVSAVPNIMEIFLDTPGH